MVLVCLGIGIGFVSYKVQWVAAVVEWSAYRTLTCWTIVGAEKEGEGALHVPWCLRPRDCGNLAGIPVIHLFFQLVQVVIVPLGTNNIVEDIWSGGG